MPLVGTVRSNHSKFLVVLGAHSRAPKTHGRAPCVGLEKPLFWPLSALNQV